MSKIKFPFPIEDLQIILRRGMCYGTCPVYEINLNGIGYSFFFGKEFVEKIGDHPIEITSGDLLYVLNEAIRIGFWGLENKYERPMKCELNENNMVQYNPQPTFTDMPTTEIEIHIGEKVKKVHAYDGYPERFDELAELIDLMCRSKDFIGNKYE